MNNVLTALGNPIINDELKRFNEINILLNDLQYKEAIIEFLEEKIKINYLILSESLPGEINIEKLIEIIKAKDKNLKIILVREKRCQKENNNIIRNIDYQFFNNEVDVRDIIEIINNKKITEKEKIKEEIKIFKKYILNKNNKTIKKIKSNELNEVSKLNDNKIITILGSSGVGKSIFTIMLSKTLKNNKNKILIIDFDILNSNLHTIFGVKKNLYNSNQNDINKKYDINNFIIKINNNVDLISGLDLIFSEDKKIDYKIIISKIMNIKNKYDYIIIDTSSECFFEYNKNLILMSDISLFLVEANLLEIKKSRKLLDIYEKEWKIYNKKIKIIINKYNSNSIKDKILLNIFNGQEIVGKIKMSNYYNYLINKNNKTKIENNDIKKEYIKLSEKILKVNFKENNIKKICKKIKNDILLKIYN